MRSRIAVVIALAAAAIVLPVSATARAASPSCLGSLPQLQQVAGGDARPLAGSTPVLFVHGINSGPGVWDPGSASSISGQAAGITGVTAWTFSYAHQSLLWVTNPAIGPDLAAAIGCLAVLSGHKVIIVGHSMGGLAAQEALGQGHGRVAADVAELITIGTPFDGSQILTAGEEVIDGGQDLDNPYVVLVEALLSACAGVADHSAANPCGLVSVLRSPVGTALEANSAAIASLPPWPTGLPVYDTAGDMKVFVGVFGIGHGFDFGDGAVTLSSATAHDTVSTPTISYCAKTLWHVLSIDTGLCFHTSLPNNPAIIDAVLHAIRSAASDQIITCGTVPDGPQGSLEVTIIKAPVSCATARTVVYTYLNHPPEAPQGSGGFVRIGTWLCSSEDGYMFAKTGHAGNCGDSQGNISIDKPGATPRSCVALFLPWNC